VSTFPPPEPARHGWAAPLKLLGAIRRIAHHRSLEPDDAMRKIRDQFLDWDERRGVITPLSSERGVVMDAAGQP